jgi:large subunit ribosomal protein L13
MIIDATDMILGRMLSFAAKQALLGQKVDIVNCEKAVITGKKEYVFHKYWYRARDMGGPRKGPFMPRMPDRFVRKLIKGMLPMNKPRGKETYKRIMCYIGVPAELKGKEVAKVPYADSANLTTLKKVSVGDTCKYIGGKWNEPSL